jgi:hypothetical protein
MAMLALTDNFSDADLRRILQRALRSILIAAVIAAAVLWLASGWRNAVMLLVGAGVSATGVWEWQRLLTALIARMDAPANGPETSEATPRNTPSPMPIVAMFFLRLVLAAAVLYASLRYCNGSVYALLGGLALSLLALGFEAVRLLHKS